MDHNHFMAELRRYKILTMFFAASVLVALVTLGIVVIKQPKPVTILMPPAVSGPYKIRADLLDEQYVLDAGVHLAEALLNVTPETTQWRKRAVMEWVHPAYREKIASLLDAENTAIAQRSLSSSFTVKQAHFDAQNQTSVIDGVLTRWVASRQFAQEAVRVRVSWTRDDRAAVLLKDVNWSSYREQSEED